MGIQPNLPLKSKSSQIYGLDFIRFAAALLVSVYHFAFSSWILPDSDLHAFLPATRDFRLGTGLPGLVGSACKSSLSCPGL